jgi:hypothetical protein
VFYLFQEVDIRLVRYPSPLHLPSQLFRLRILVHLLQISQLEKHDQFIGVTGVAEEPTTLRTARPAGGSICIKDRLPPGVVLDFLSDK